MRNERASLTAARVAQALYFVASEPRYAAVLPEGWANVQEEILKGATWSFPMVRRILAWRWYRRFLFWFERRWTPGYYAHMAVRKRFMQERVCSALQEGAVQFVALGAGLDPLGAWIARRANGVSIIEVDHPATQRAKAVALQRGGIPSLLTLLPVDLSRASLEEELGSHPTYRCDAPTVFAAEGLLMYLRGDEVKALFQAMRSLSVPGSRVVFTFIEIDERGRPYVFSPLKRLTNWSLRLAAEPFLWGIRRSDLEDFLQSLGWNLVENAKEAELIGQWFAEVEGRPLEGEYFAVAEST